MIVSTTEAEKIERGSGLKGEKWTWSWTHWI
jgi:hypothetical protein